MGFSSSKVLETLLAFPAASRYHVAFSGGMDSHLLLHVLAGRRERLAGELRAIHVDHGISPLSAEWSRHCRDVCAGLGVPCDVVRVDARPGPGESREAAARDARYGALAELVGAGEALVTAHHADDQAETVLLQLMRGAGVRGLAAMAPRTPFAAGWLLRPLLGFTRAELQEEASALGLAWIEDPSNFDTGLDRNYIRHEVMPRLRERWPAVASTVSRSAAHLAEGAELLDSIAADDQLSAAGEDGTLDLHAVAALPPARAKNLIRHWLRRCGVPVPDSRRLAAILEQMSGARPDAAPRVAWRGGEVRRYRGRLYALAPLPTPPSEPLPWALDRPLVIPAMGTLVARRGSCFGLDPLLAGAGNITVRFRVGGERCRPAGGRPTRELKKLLQEHGVPPWQRDRIPLVYVGEELAAIAGLAVCEPFARPGGLFPRVEQAPGVETGCENNEN